MAGGLTLAGFAGGLAWWLDLPSHFRVQYALVLGVVALAAALLRRRAVALAAVALGVLNLAVLGPVWGDDAAATDETPELTMLLLNVNSENEDYRAVAALIRERDADVVALAELSPAWLAGLEEALVPYGSRRLATRDSTYGVGLFSRLPLSEAVIFEPGGPDYPAVAATVAGRTGAVRLVLVHPPPPIRGFRVAAHDAILDAAARQVVAAEGPAVVVGDLNATPWSAPFHDLVSRTGLTDSREGYGLQTTWPATLPAVLRIPIDHVLATAELRATDREVGPEVGSDHLPVWVELARAGP